MAEEERASSPEMTRRRGSLGRALDRFKNVLKRTHSKRTIATVAIEEATSISTQPTPSSAPANVDRSTVEAQNVLPLPKPSSIMGDPLEADEDGENGPDQDEDMLLVPNTGSSRTGLSDEKARLLFNKYGVKYGNRRLQTQEPARKVRRVERPLRIRVHWTCHECKRGFAASKTCADCGHRKCDECIREPPRRARDRMGDMRRQMSEEEDVQEGSSAPMQAETVAALQTATSTDDEDIPDEIVNPSTFLFTIRARSSGGVQYVHRPTAQILRRKCHECTTPFLPSSKTDCQNCGHVRCERCPRHPPKPHKHGTMANVDEPIRAGPVLERIYKKPRQRIRWTCDRCNAPATREKCTKCDHQRCGGCLRDPPKKEMRPFDPAAVQSVQDRLDAMLPSREERPILVATHS